MNNDQKYLIRAIEISERSTPVATAFRVGAVVVTPRGEVFEGYTHESSPTNHAEEEAIDKALAAGVTLAGSTIYASMEPCSTRASKPRSCSQLIIEHGFKKVVFAYKEPPLFVQCTGAQTLAAAGVEVLHLPEFSHRVREINVHLFERE